MTSLICGVESSFYLEICQERSKNVLLITLYWWEEFSCNVRVILTLFGCVFEHLGIRSLSVLKIGDVCQLEEPFTE